MRTPARRRWLTRSTAVAVAAVVAIGAPGCGGGAEGGELDLAEFDPVSASSLPDTVLDLRVEQEHPSVPLEQEPYIDAMGMFSLRRGDLLQATLQVSRFADADKLDDELFQVQVASQVGTAARPTVVHVGERRVYIVSTGRETVAVWFDGAYMLIASIREEYPRPRALLRALAELEGVT